MGPDILASLKELVDLIAPIRAAQHADTVFGGSITKGQREASIMYVDVIGFHAAQLDDAVKRAKIAIEAAERTHS